MKSKDVKWSEMKRSEQRWYKKIGAILEVDPKSLPNMLWSKFNLLLHEKGYETILAFTKKVDAASSGKRSRSSASRRAKPRK